MENTELTFKLIVALLSIIVFLLTAIWYVIKSSVQRFVREHDEVIDIVSNHETRIIKLETQRK